MKRLLLLLFPLLLVSCAVSGRNSKNNPMASLFNNGSSVSSYAVNSVNGSSVSNSDKSFPVYEKIDVDLTVMNATLVYSQVNNMMNDPGAYRQKIVKMSGPFRPFESTLPNYCYPAILIRDATACCASGIEFLLYDTPLCSMAGGNGYPLYDEEATIVGRFETYIEDAYMYIHLVDAIWLRD